MVRLMKAQWKNVITDGIVILVCFTCSLLYRASVNRYSTGMLFGSIVLFGAYILMIVILHAFPKKAVKDKDIYQNKRAIWVFLICEIALQITIFSLNSFWGINNGSNMTGTKYSKLIIILLYLFITIFVMGICYAFHIRLRYFSWKISFGSILLIFILSMLYIAGSYGYAIIHNQFHPVINLKNLVSFVLNLAYKSVYPGLYEELLYRGVLIAALKGFGLDDNKSNIIQAFIFGISHIGSWGTASWIFLLSTSLQAILGYVLGKLYLKTKSLTPCILLHGFYNAIGSL